jgi:hypothetical protein
MLGGGSVSRGAAAKAVLALVRSAKTATTLAQSRWKKGEHLRFTTSGLCVMGCESLSTQRQV